MIYASSTMLYKYTSIRYYHVLVASYTPLRTKHTALSFRTSNIHIGKFPQILLQIGEFPKIDNYHST